MKAKAQNLWDAAKEKCRVKSMAIDEHIYIKTKKKGRKKDLK